MEEGIQRKWNIFSFYLEKVLHWVKLVENLENSKKEGDWYKGEKNWLKSCVCVYEAKSSVKKVMTERGI